MRDKPKLRFNRTDLPENPIFSSFADLAKAVFDLNPCPAWPVWGLFDADGRCMAGLQCCRLVVACDGVPISMAALRNIAVAVDWRGRGLMRDLMEHVLPWCDAHAAVTLLYTATSDLYGRFGFAPLEQHAFDGPAPAPSGAPARAFDPIRDAGVSSRLLATRSPVSFAVAIVEDGGLTAAALASGDWPVVYDAELDALIVSEWDDDTLVLIDVVATRIPSAAAILGATGGKARRLRTMFPPDRLAWHGVPVPDATGLMARGAPPPAMRRPFMLPPSQEF